MRIGLNGMLLWGEYSGVEVAIAKLFGALARSAPEEEFVLYVGRDYAGPTFDLPNWTIRRAPVRSANRWARLVWEQTCLPSWFAADRVDLVHAPGYVLPLCTRVPVVLSVYDLFALTHSELSRPANVFHYRLTLPPSVRKAACLLVPTAYVERELLQHFTHAEGKTRVVPLGVDPHQFTPATRRECNEVRKTYNLVEGYLLFVGNLEPKKNLPRLLEAFSQARRTLPSGTQLVIAGKPAWGPQDLDSLVQSLGVAESVRLLGYVPPAHLPALYSAAGAFVFPSLCEGFGLPALEAMSCGTPVIASTAQGLREVVGDAALLVDPLSTDALTTAMSRLLSDGALRAELIESGFHRAAQFTWERAAERVLECYREACRS